MSNVIAFPRTKILVDRGFVTKYFIHSATGVTEYAGRGWTFFVLLIEPDGGEECLWDGADYDDALRAAVEAAREWRGVIVDQIGGDE